MRRSLGHPVKQRGLLDSALYGGAFGGKYRKSRENEHPLKHVLQNSRNRKAPITLPSTPFDYKDERS